MYGFKKNGFYVENFESPAKRNFGSSIFFLAMLNSGKKREPGDISLGEGAHLHQRQRNSEQVCFIVPSFV
jgi:hypothetical protein